MANCKAVLISLLWFLSLGSPCQALDLQGQFPRPQLGHKNDQEFTVTVQPHIEGECLSYWGYYGADQATILIPRTLLLQLAASPGALGKHEKRSEILDQSRQAKQLLDNTDGKVDSWGCAHIRQEFGAAAFLLFDLLESGSVVVIDDAAGKPVGEIIVKYLQSSANTSTYHLRQRSGAFLIRDPEKITRDAEWQAFHRRPRPQWAIERIPEKATDQPLYEFIRQFIASCRSDDITSKVFYLSHIHFPFKYKFSVVDEDGKESSTGTMKEMKLNPDTGGFGLPVCVGDGELEDVSARRERARAIVELTFGSGPNEELQFKLIQNKWMLEYVEWIDH